MDVQRRAVDALAAMDGEVDDNDGYYAALLDAEQGIQAAAVEAMAADGVTEATKNMMAQLADESEQRAYKMGQRVKDDDDDT